MHNNTCRRYNIFDDETEQEDIAKREPVILARLIKRLEELEASAWTPNRGSPTTEACNAARQLYKGFYGPFVGL